MKNLKKKTSFSLAGIEFDMYSIYISQSFADKQNVNGAQSFENAELDGHPYLTFKSG